MGRGTEVWRLFDHDHQAGNLLDVLPRRLGRLKVRICRG
jgi:hypothetical protein